MNAKLSADPKPCDHSDPSCRTIGVSASGTTSLEYKITLCKIPAGEPTILIDPLTNLDQFDVVWFERFGASGGGDIHYAVAKNRDANKGILVIPTGEEMTRKNRFFSSDGYYAPERRVKESDRKPFVRTDGNFIYYSSKHPLQEDEKNAERVLDRIHQLLK